MVNNDAISNEEDNEVESRQEAFSTESCSSESIQSGVTWIGELKLTTFNLLAPCYKRNSYGRESSRESDWRKRLDELLLFIEQDLSSSDIICFQEYWSEETYYRILEDKIQELGYNLYYAQRTGRKSDGCCILVKTHYFEVIDFRGKCIDEHICSQRKL